MKTSQRKSLLREICTFNNGCHQAQTSDAPATDDYSSVTTHDASAFQLIVYISVTSKLSNSPTPVSGLRHDITIAMDGLDKAHVEVCDRYRKVDNTCRSPGNRHTNERYPF